MSAAIIIGRANTVWDDVAEARSLFPCDVTIAVNGVACDYPDQIDHWVSFHAELFPMWIAKRRSKGWVDINSIWTASSGRRRTPIEEELGCKMVDGQGGSSGMIALRVALILGVERVILAGIPLEATAGHYDEPGNWDEAAMHRKAWQVLPVEVKERVRSMSGWTRTFLGYPTYTWFNGE